MEWLLLQARDTNTPHSGNDHPVWQCVTQEEDGLAAGTSVAKVIDRVSLQTCRGSDDPSRILLEG
jgi:hypothetical protein